MAYFQGRTVSFREYIYISQKQLTWNQKIAGYSRYLLLFQRGCFRFHPLLSEGWYPPKTLGIGLIGFGISFINKCSTMTISFEFKKRCLTLKVQWIFGWFHGCVWKHVEESGVESIGLISPRLHPVCVEVLSRQQRRNNQTSQPNKPHTTHKKQTINQKWEGEEEKKPCHDCDGSNFFRSHPRPPSTTSHAKRGLV